MKKTILSIILSAMLILSFAQTKVNLDFTSFVYEYQNELKNSPKSELNPDALILTKYKLRKLQNQYYVPLLAKTNSEFNRQQLENLGVRIGSVIGDFVTLRVPLNMMNSSFDLPGIENVELARTLNANLNKATKDTRVDSVQKGFTLPQPFTGKNVIIGITDWGFDYTNPMFYDTNLTHTRILAAWDQYRNIGPAPAGYDFGTVISGENALLQAQCDTFNIYHWATHGSHVAGIAGGSGAGTVYRGAAIDANYLMTTILVDEASVVDAFVWMKDYANNAGKRLVINMSWGLYWIGNLDGTALVNQIIDQLSAQNVVFVSSAGNNGDENLHIKKQFTSAQDTLKTVIGFNAYTSYPTMWGQSVSAWGQAGKQFSVALRVLNSTNSTLFQTPFYSTSNASNYLVDTIVIGSDSIFYNIAFESVNPQNQRPHLRLRVKNTHSAYKIALLSTADNPCSVHYWNVIELVNDVGNWGGPFLTAGTDYTAGDALYSIGDPASTKSVISVAAHYADVWLTNGNVTYGSLASFSSNGPTLDERMKPDISAPGANVASSVSSFTSEVFQGTSIVASIVFNGRTYKFVKFSGTSMSGPMVAGIVALMLEANPQLSPAQVKYIIQKTAREDIKTGNIPDTGSTKWGYGKINALAAIKLALQTTNSQSVKEEISFVVYPNPTSNKVWILTDDALKPIKVDVFQVDGKFLFSKTIHSNEEIDVVALPKGLYFLSISDGKSRTSMKFIKE